MIGGRLKLKGKKVKLPKRHRAEREAPRRREEKAERKVEEKLVTFEIENGTGNISLSHTTIHGDGTLFEKELRVGDALIVKDPESGELVPRKIAMVLTDRSASIDLPFKFKIKLSEFKFQKKPELVKDEEKKSFEDFVEEKEKARKEKKSKKKKYTEIDVRKKSGMWSYRMEKIRVKGDLSRDEILDIKQKYEEEAHH